MREPGGSSGAVGQPGGGAAAGAPSPIVLEAWNAGKWVNPDFDKMVEGARAEHDFKKRKKFYEEAVRLIVEDAPVAVLLHLNEKKVFHKYVKGFQMIPAGLIDMHRVWLDKA